MNQIEALLDAVRAAPCLPGARCRGRHALFDPAAPGENPEVVKARHTQALGLCAHCQSLARCGEWLNSLPARQRPYGVTAGAVRHVPPVGRPRKEAI